MKNKSYINITNEWKQSRTTNRHKVKERNFVRIDERIYKISKSNKNVVFEKDIELLRPIAKWMSKTFGSKVYINPTVKVPEKIRTPDFTYKNEQWDLKTILGNNLDYSVKKTKGQANNFILDLTNSKLDFKEILNQLHRIYNSPYRKWVNIIIIKKGNTFNVYKRK